MRFLLVAFLGLASFAAHAADVTNQTLVAGVTPVAGFVDTDVLFADGTVIGQSDALTFAKSTGFLTVGSASTPGTIQLSGANGTVTELILTSGGTFVWQVIKPSNNHLLIQDSLNSFTNWLDLTSGGNATVGEGSSSTFTLTSKLVNTGAPTSCSGQPTGTIANVAGVAMFCP
jgi:hypothetical protein